jgi:hypothetical protein
MLLKEINDDHSGVKAHQLIFDVLAGLNELKNIGMHKVSTELSGPLIYDPKACNKYFSCSLSVKPSLDNTKATLDVYEFEIYDYDQIESLVRIPKNEDDYLTQTLNSLKNFEPIKIDNDHFIININRGLDCYDILIEILNYLMDNLLTPMVMHNNIDFGTIINSSYYQSQFMLYETIQSIIEFNLTNLNSYIVNETLLRFNGETQKVNIRLCYTSIDNCILVMTFKDNITFQVLINNHLEYEEYDVFYHTFSNKHGEIQITISPQKDEDIFPMIYEILDKIT